MAKSTKGVGRTRSIEFEHDGFNVIAECRGLTVRAARETQDSEKSDAMIGFQTYELIVISMTIDGEDVDPLDITIDFLEPFMTAYNDAFKMVPTKPVKT